MTTLNKKIPKRFENAKWDDVAKELKIVDLGEAAAVLAHNYELDRMYEAKRKTHKIFVFHDKDGNASGVIGKYQRRQLMRLS